MSEYQYYEFQAIDRPLDAKAMSALRAITSRATITPTRLVNEYHWGDFKGDPDRLMDQYFDAHLYFANWGTHRLMLRLPSRAFDVAAAKPYTAPHVVTVRQTREHVVFDFYSSPEDFDEVWYEGEDDDGTLASLIPLRHDLAAGDLRCLYLGWLVGVEAGEVDEDAMEPPVPPGLQNLTGSLQAFADFFRLDPHLIAVAAAGSGRAAPTGPATEELADWVARLPEAEKDRALVRLLEGETAFSLSGELLQRFRKDRAKARSGAGKEAVPSVPRRVVRQLLAARNGIAEEEARREAERRAAAAAERAREQAAARERHLNAIAGREDDLWRQVEEAVAKKLPKEYDRAMELLADLRDLAARAGTPEIIAPRVRQLREKHARKGSFIRRLDKAGFG